MNPPTDLIWVEISAGALRHNFELFRRLAGPGVQVCPVVKSNAYGHGLDLVAPLLAEAGADRLAVNSPWEAARLRELGLALPLLVLGHVPLDELPRAAELGLELTVYNEATLELASRAAAARRRTLRLHLKVETGTHRQGVLPEEMIHFARRVRELPGLELHGLSTHYANIEDTTEHSYARIQRERYEGALESLRAEGLEPPCRHTACTAAAILFPETYFTMLRVGIGIYGLWPSKETRVSAGLLHRELPFELRPVLSWWTRLVQIKDVPAGAFIGYGCTHRTTRPTRIGILPVGYYDGYDRSLSGGAYVLIRGRRAPLLGRVCMNLSMVDLTDVPEPRLEEPVLLLGSDDGDAIPAETMAAWAGTINYEVVTRIGGHLPRQLVD